MEEFEISVAIFLELLKKYDGRSPEISLNYSKREIYIKDAPCGFMKLLYSNDRVCAHLIKGGIKVEFFKEIDD